MDLDTLETRLRQLRAGEQRLILAISGKSPQATAGRAATFA